MAVGSDFTLRAGCLRGMSRLGGIVTRLGSFNQRELVGHGRTASSDGQFFPAAARYGAEPGVKAYSHVSDRFSPFAIQTIPATVHEAPYILDGLLMNEPARRVREQYADTGGFTDHVFAACSILGYAFVPRIPGPALEAPCHDRVDDGPQRAPARPGRLEQGRGAPYPQASPSTSTNAANCGTEPGRGSTYRVAGLNLLVRDHQR